MIRLTNKSIRNRYLAEKARQRLLGKNWTYQDMARLFESDDRAVYTWVSTLPHMQHLPTNEFKRKKLADWINDGVMKEKK